MSKLGWGAWRLWWTGIFVVSMYGFRFGESLNRLAAIALILIALNALNELFEPRKRVPNADA